MKQEPILCIGGPLCGEKIEYRGHAFFHYLYGEAASFYSYALRRLEGNMVYVDQTMGEVEAVEHLMDFYHRNLLQKQKLETMTPLESDIYHSNLSQKKNLETITPVEGDKESGNGDIPEDVRKRVLAKFLRDCALVRFMSPCHHTTQLRWGKAVRQTWGHQSLEEIGELNDNLYIDYYNGESVPLSGIQTIHVGSEIEKP